MYMPQQPVHPIRVAPPAAMPAEVKHLPLASSYTPVQTFRSLMDDSRSLRKGTIFEELYLPLEEGGLPRGR
ncbi:MAG: spore coat associated protein CotJA [Oscillospiraceae bacterium]|nr:spore coat associated protein CotJA [Oscillospiraceae bacterium]